MTQLDSDRKCAIFQYIRWHKFFECFCDVTHCRSGGFRHYSIEYYEFPGSIGDLGDDEIGRKEVIIRS